MTSSLTDISRLGSTRKVRLSRPTRGCAVMYLPSTPIKTYSKSSTTADSWAANGNVPDGEIKEICYFGEGNTFRLLEDQDFFYYKGIQLRYKKNFP